ncbi:MAG TPA: hypothetical protein VFV08_09320, partial [Puia sp.]|nr:hypothetical protein [Puia sp.]
MIFNLTLSVAGNGLQQELPINYQYYFSSAIYKSIAYCDSAFSAFLHDIGYSNSATGEKKRFKLFTFSDLHTPFYVNGDRMVLTGSEASITVCFHVPIAAEKFIKGIFEN